MKYSFWIHKGIYMQTQPNSANRINITSTSVICNEKQVGASEIFTYQKMKYLPKFTEKNGFP